MSYLRRPLSRMERGLLLVVLVLAIFGVIAYLQTSPAGAESTSESPTPTPRTAVTERTSTASGGTSRGKSHRHRAHPDSLITDSHYVGPPQGLQRGAKKFERYTALDLNAVDSLTLLRVPGIGPAYAHRFLQLRSRLGGYYTVLQLQELYGVDEDKFIELRPWFVYRTPPKRYPLGSLRADSLPRHPYLSGAQQRLLRRMVLRYQTRLSWSLLRTDSLFSRRDSIRLSPYFPDGH